MSNSESLRRRLRRKIDRFIFELSTQELKFMVETANLESTDILLYLELMLYPRTKQFRQRCKKWDYKLTWTDVKYPTLHRLINYQHIYENWDGQEPFVGRKDMPISFYLDTV